jgi:hypothetical protein
VAAARPGSADEVEPLFHLRRRLAEPHLPQGSPTSPALANLCAFSLDLRLASLARTIGATYSRYADDLTFSGDGTLAAAAPRLLRLVAAIADDEGFALNPRKTRIMRARVQQRVTGMVVNRHPNAPRPDYDTLKATLTSCLRHGPSTQTRGTPQRRLTRAVIAARCLDGQKDESLGAGRLGGSDPGGQGRSRRSGPAAGAVEGSTASSR